MILLFQVGGVYRKEYEQVFLDFVNCVIKQKSCNDIPNIGLYGVFVTNQ